MDMDQQKWPGSEIYQIAMPCQKVEEREFNVCIANFLNVSDIVKVKIAEYPIMPIAPENQLPHNKIELKLSNGRIIRYLGQFQGDTFAGRGQLNFMDTGDLWICYFMFGDANGDGQIYFGNGNYFEGNISYTQPKSGKLIYANGDKYEGPISEKKPSGLGKMLYADGSFYTGHFKDGVKHGDGKLVSSKGQIFEGQFEDDKVVQN